MNCHCSTRFATSPCIVHCRVPLIVALNFVIRRSNNEFGFNKVNSYCTSLKITNPSRSNTVEGNSQLGLWTDRLKLAIIDAIIKTQVLQLLNSVTVYWSDSKSTGAWWAWSRFLSIVLSWFDALFLHIRQVLKVSDKTALVIHASLSVKYVRSTEKAISDCFFIDYTQSFFSTKCIF